MARNIRTLFLFVFAPLFLFVLLYHYLHHLTVSSTSSAAPSIALVYDYQPPAATTRSTTRNLGASFVVNNVITESLEVSWVFSPRLAPQLSPSPTFPIPSVAVLLPDWEVLVLVSPDFASPLSRDVNDPYVCLFDKGITSPAFPAGVLPFPDRFMFKCELPRRVRRRLPYKQPVMVKSSSLNPRMDSTPPTLLRWNFVVYDSLTTEDDDVVLFVKGVNNRQGINHEPKEFQCAFFAGDDAVKTVVTSSMQEVFRCKRPDLTAFPSGEKRIKASLEILGPDPVLVPTVAYYTAPRNLAPKTGKSLLCVATMVRNVAKFLKEWVLYHSKIGVDKFILYDNGSEDDLQKIVESLVGEGFDITTYFWLWPKTQEAGFSHSAVYANSSCRWIMYVDVDEFVYSPAWAKVSKPSKALLHSLLPKLRNHSTPVVAQVNIGCVEFGPSGQTVHPETGVTQGYNCRKKGHNRHKSIVLLEAIDESLMNAIHHFILKPGYMSKKLSLHTMVVNHYKFQAWPEFKAKFRRRVSAYVFDWTQPLNPNSNDRTPGLGYSPVEPADWSTKFCEVYDDGLKNLTRRWFGVESPEDYKMAWQR